MLHQEAVPDAKLNVKKQQRAENRLSKITILRKLQKLTIIDRGAMVEPVQAIVQSV